MQLDEMKGAEESAIQSEVEAIAEAVRTKDVNSFLSRCAPDVVIFDMLPPLKHEGMAAVRRNWDAALGRFQGQAEYEMRDLEIEVDGNIAFCHCLARFGGTLRDGSHMSTWLRSTIGFQKFDGRWKVVHEHVSVPIDMQNGLGMQLEP
jgi:ketosteroid isomerase-like protein